MVGDRLDLDVLNDHTFSDLGVSSPLLTDLPVSFVDGVKQLTKAGCFVDRPQSVEGLAKHIDVALGEQSYRDDPFPVHNDPAYQLSCGNAARGVRCR